MSMRSATWIAAIICTTIGGGWMTAPGLAETDPSAPLARSAQSSRSARQVQTTSPKRLGLTTHGQTKVASGAIAPQTSADQLQYWLDICATATPEIALDACQQATMIDPDFAIAWDNMGAVLERLGRYEEAVEALAQAIDLTPEDANIWYNLGVVLAKLQQYQASVAAFDEAYRLNPEDHQARKFADLLRSQL